MADRPLECSHCKKPIAVEYKEITQDLTVATSMCSDCPNLLRKLHGSAVNDERMGWEAPGLGICCGSCGTHLEWVKMGNPLGCAECYVVFADTLLSDFVAEEKVPERLKKQIEMRSHLPLHIGKSKKVADGIGPSEQLTKLNEALKEAINKENFEQAAWLRDQIKSLLEKRDNGDA